MNRNFLASLGTLATLGRPTSVALTVDQFEKNQGVGEAQFAVFPLLDDEDRRSRPICLDLIANTLKPLVCDFTSRCGHGRAGTARRPMSLVAKAGVGTVMHIDWCTLTWPTGFRCVTIGAIPVTICQIAKMEYVKPTDPPGFSRLQSCRRMVQPQGADVPSR